jgi:hypothetical protein
MKKRRNQMVRSLVLFLTILSLSSCSYIEKQLGLGEDNWIEEFGEFALEYETGIRTDFTPGSPE